VYVANFGSYNETYGSLGGIIVLMLWFYITGLAILAGAEMNAEIEHASPYGKNPGEKVPGQRKKLGARAARAFAGAGEQTAAPPPEVAPSPTPSALPASKTQGYFPGALLFLSAWLLRRRRTRD
jgi:membrane protein